MEEHIGMCKRFLESGLDLLGSDFQQQQVQKTDSAKL